jgi:uncharacterized protein involved in outer membrane biogenesis
VRWVLWGLAGLLGLVVIGGAAVALLGVNVSADPWRRQLSEAMTGAIGREVRFEGAMEMRLSLTPSIHVGGITVANPAGFSSPTFASLGHARLKLDLMALMHGEVRVQELSAEGVHVHLERNNTAQVNWLFQLARTTDAGPAREGGEPSVRLVAIDRIELKDLLVDYLGGPGMERHVFTLERLDGQGGEGQPLTVKMQGSVEKGFLYTVSFSGGSLSALTGEHKPWPVDFSLEFAGTQLRIAGSVRPDSARTSASLGFSLKADNLSNLERLLQVSLPPVGATGLSGQVSWENGLLDIRDLRGNMGQSQLDGQLKVDITRAIPKVRGEFHLPVLDVTPFQAAPDAPRKPVSGEPVDLQALKAKHEKREFEFRELAWVEADLALQVDRWLGLPGDVRDSALQVSVHGGILKAPLHATVADVPLVGEIDLDGAAALPAFQISLGADKTNLGRLARLLMGADGVQGKAGHFLLRFAATGKSLSALVQTLQMRLEVGDGELTYGNVKGGKPVELRLDNLAIELPPGGRLNGKIRGSLLGERFSADFKGGDLPTLSEQVQWPVEVLVTATGATLSIQGRVAAPEKDSGTDLTVKLSTPRAGNVARWLGLSPASTVPVALSARIRVESDAWRLNDLDIQLGKTRIKGDLARVGIGQAPLVQAKLRVQNLELAELESMLPPPKPGPSEPVIELPILPKGINLADADIDVGVTRIALKPAVVTDITFSGRIREGRMQPSPFGAKIADTEFGGAIALDLRRQVPEATVWVAATKPDIGRLLRTLGVAQGLDIQAGLLQVQVQAKGHRLGDMLAQSALIATVDSGTLSLGQVNGKGGVHIAVNSALVEAKPGEPVHVDVDGLIDQTPIKLRIASGTPAELLRASSHVPFSIHAELAETTVDLSGKVTLPISQQELELQLAISGRRVNSLDELARTSLPHWGPYALQSRFHVSSTGYDMPGLVLKVGSSELNGKGSLIFTGVRPRVDVQLSAPRIQLDDFKLDGWVLVEKAPEKKEEKKLSEEELRQLAREASDKTQEMLSPATLRRQDVRISVDVAEVQSGQDRLGSGSLRVELEDGKLAFGPAEVNVSGGSARLWLGYRPDASGIALDAKIRVDSFDYGVLARRLKPQSDLQGLFSLQLDLKSQTPSLQRAVQNGDGRLDFAVWPKNMKSGIFDLWAVNLFVALIPAVDPAAESKVNCAVGRFDLRKGVLSQESLLLDTSRMRVTGSARVDFDSETLSMRLVPKPKQPQFFSLAIPVEANGKLTSPKIGVSAGAVAGTTLRLVTSIVTTPFEKMFSKEVPRDGNDVCANALKESRELR